MRLIITFFRWLRSLGRTKAVKQDIDEELRFHIEQRTAENIAKGMSPEDAARDARKRFGNLQSVREDCRDVKGASFGEAAGRDIRFAFRTLRRNRGFTVVAVFTVALCIGANFVIFAVVDGILLRPLPFPKPERLVAMFNEYPKAELGRSESSFANLYNRRGKIPAFASVAASKQDAVNVGEAGASRRVEILRVSPDFFETLGVGPVLGRFFIEEEMMDQAHHVAILSHAFWHNHFGGSPDVLGHNIRINGFNKTIIGVLPPDFRFLSSKAEILLPLSSDLDARGINSLHDSGQCEMIARLKSGATLAEAQAQIDAQNTAVGRDFPYAKQVEATGFRTMVAPLHADHVAAIRPTLLLLQAGGLFLLLIGAVNLTNLLLVRASARAKELAIRQSLGANWTHLARQVVTENLILTLIGGVGGLGVGAVGVRLLTVFGVDRLPLGLQIAVNGRVVFATLAGAVVLGIVVGIPVLWFNLRNRPVHALHAETRGSTGSHAVQRLRHSFVAAQIALAFVLLTGAGLLAVNLKRAMEISPGFRPDSVLAGHISMLHPNYLANAAQLQFTERVVEEISRQPGVQAVGIANNLPVGGKESGNLRRVMTAIDRPAGSREVVPIAPNIYGVTGDFFHALGIPLKAGRLFDGQESHREERVCIVDETFARRTWDNINPVGQIVCDGPEVVPDRTRFRVVGLVGDVKQTELTEAPNDGTLYVPFRDNPLGAGSVYVFIRTSQRPEVMAATVQKTIRAIEPELPINDLRTMETRIRDTLLLRRSPLLLAGTFALMALLLASIGTYGVLSFAVAQRRREIGVRMALGALPGQIGRQFLSLGLRWFCIGTMLGLGGAWLAGRAMRSILFTVPPLHIPTLVGTALVMGAVSLVACLLPALRASRVEPMEALRSE